MRLRACALICLILAGGCTNYPQWGSSDGYGMSIVGAQGQKFAFQNLVRASGFPPPCTNAPLRPVAKLAVAEMGKPMPTAWIVDAFSGSGRYPAVLPCTGGEPAVFKRPVYATTHPTTQEMEAVAKEVARDLSQQAIAAVDAARSAARDAGCDYVAVVAWDGGGQLQGGVLQLLNLLIFPMYVIPNERAVAKVGGMVLLVDTNDGTVVRLHESTAEASRYGTYSGGKEVVRRTLAKAQERLATSFAHAISAKERKR